MEANIWEQTYGSKHMGANIWKQTYGSKHMGANIWKQTYGSKHMGAEYIIFSSVNEGTAKYKNIHAFCVGRYY